MTPEEHRDWLAARQTGIGASELPAILGLVAESQATIHDVWARKVGLAGPSESTTRTEWGHELEPIIARRWAERHGQRIAPATFRRHPEIPWAIATPDYLVLAEPLSEDPGGILGLLECKTAEPWKRQEWGRDGEEGGDGTAPDSYLVQVQWQMFVTGATRAWLAVLIGFGDERSIEVQRDDSLIGLLVEKAAAFWRCVETRTPPRIDGTDSCRDALTRLYSGRPEPDKELPAHALALVEEAERAAVEEKAAGARKEAARSALRAMMGNSTLGAVGDRLVRWSAPRTVERLDSGRLRKERPDIWQQYARAGEPERRMTFGRMKE